MKKSPSSLKEEDLDSYDVDDAENKDTTTNAKPLCEEDEESERKFQSLGKLIVLIIIMVRNLRPTYLPIDIFYTSSSRREVKCIFFRYLGQEKFRPGLMTTSLTGVVI